MVRLKDYAIKQGLNSNQDFNSSMVRLKAVIGVIVCLITLIFQFQYGAIESVTRALAVLRKFLISIPVWCD